ncbi:MAG: cell division protein ZipA C-terminal FtsZ-binding domain-containing protein [Methylococcaceae bacterium]
MDKELLRIAIIATGFIIIVGMVISAYLKDKKAQEDDEDDDFYDDDEFEEVFEDEFEEEFMAPVKNPSVTQTLKNAYTEKVQQRQQVPLHNHAAAKITPEFDEPEKQYEEPVSRPSAAPSIVHFSVITKGNEDFNGVDIFNALEELGLEYGSTKIFERIDEHRFVRFSVACITEPGTFPSEDKEIESFYCPGVSFFMQPDGLDDCVAVFDDYVSTIVLFAQRMDGVVLDHRRQVLTQEMVAAIRKSLEQFSL